MLYLTGNLKMKIIKYLYIYIYIPFKVTIFPASCQKVRGYPTTIIVNLIENHYIQTLFLTH